MMKTNNNNTLINRDLLLLPLRALTSSTWSEAFLPKEWYDGKEKPRHYIYFEYRREDVCRLEGGRSL